MKIIRISDKLHTKLKEHADTDRRTINGEAEIILELYFADAEGGLSSEQVSKNRMLEAQEMREHIVNEGRKLGILPETPPTQKNDIAAVRGVAQLRSDKQYNFCAHGNVKGFCKKGC